MIAIRVINIISLLLLLVTFAMVVYLMATRNRARCVTDEGVGSGRDAVSSNAEPPTTVQQPARAKKAEQFTTRKILTETETGGYSNLSTVDLRSTIDSAVNDPDGPLLKYTARPGMIVMWHSPDPPDGWALCNGQGLLSDNKTPIPNLVSRFPFGIGSGTDQGAFNTLGGSSTAKLDPTNLPSHNHTWTSDGWRRGANGSTLNGTYFSYGDIVQNSAQTVTTSSTVGNEEFSIMPPYTTVYFIIKL